MEQGSSSGNSAELDGASEYYQPPESQQDSPPSPPPLGKSERSSAPFGIGLTMIIGGAILALYGVIGGLFVLVVQNVTSTMGEIVSGYEAEVFTEMMAAAGSIYAAQGTMRIVEGLISIGALVAGIGLIGYREWARRISLVWAVTAVVFLLADALVYVMVILPGTRRLTEVMSRQIEQLPEQAGVFGALTGASVATGVVWMVFSTLAMAVLPVLTLVLMRKPDVVVCCK